MILEDLIQLKNANVFGVTAPPYNEYPDGNLDTLNMPLAFTWLESFQLFYPSERLDMFMVEVYVNHVGQKTFSKNKQDVRDLMELFALEYAITPPNSSATNGYFRDNPVAYIVPNTVKFDGARNVITAYDQTQLHGFVFRFQIKEYPDQDCS